MNISYLFNEWWYVLILLFVMVISGLIKQYNILMPVYNLIIKKIKNKKILTTCLSLIGGILPIPGRVIVSAGLLDTITNKNKNREKFGVLDYLSTHHYYLWSPLEKTILIPIAVLHLTYFQVLYYTYPLLIGSLLYLFYYIWKLDDSDINIDSIKIVEEEKKSWYTFINWKTILFVLCIIMLANFIKHESIVFKDYLDYIIQNKAGLFVLSIFAFTTSFALGSSSKFAGITVTLTGLFGLQYFTYFFAIDFIGYLLSPVHKCVAIGQAYFKTPLIMYYKAIIIWCLILLGIGVLSLLGIIL